MEWSMLYDQISAGVRSNSSPLARWQAAETLNHRLLQAACRRGGLLLRLHGRPDRLLPAGSQAIIEAAMDREARSAIDAKSASANAEGEFNCAFIYQLANPSEEG